MQLFDVPLRGNKSHVIAFFLQTDEVVVHSISLNSDHEVYEILSGEGLIRQSPSFRKMKLQQKKLPQDLDSNNDKKCAQRIITKKLDRIE